MKKHLLMLCFTIALVESNNKRQSGNNKNGYEIGHNLPLDIKLHINNVTSNKTCATSSPMNQIKYNFTKVTAVKNIDFCNNYASRTCCSTENFNQLRMKSLYLNQDLSVDCQQALQQLICYDCDGDVGQGIRKGICSQQCEGLFEICRNDYFTIDSSSQKIKVCNRADLMCSKLSEIVTKKTEFCQLLGYEINDYSDYEEWYLQLDSEHQNEPFSEIFAPVCWNLSPSSIIFGSAPLKMQPTNKNLDGKYQMIMYILYAFVIIVVILLLLFAIIVCIQIRASRKKGQRKGGNNQDLQHDCHEHNHNE